MVVSNATKSENMYCHLDEDDSVFSIGDELYLRLCLTRHTCVHIFGKDPNEINDASVYNFGARPCENVHGIH